VKATVLTNLSKARQLGIKNTVETLFRWKLWMPLKKKFHINRCAKELRDTPANLSEQTWQAELKDNSCDVSDWYSADFYLSKSQQENVAELLRKDYPKDSDSCLAISKEIAAGNFSWLIEGWTDTSEIPNWFASLSKTESTWPQVNSNEIDYITESRPGDIRQIWELNRHQYFLVLGRAWRLSGDTRWAELFVRHLEDWIDRNPYEEGVNWVHAQEVALRAISWTWAWHLFHDAECFSKDIRIKFLKVLNWHLRYLERHVCAYGKWTHNHLISELAGLYIVSRVFPFFNRSQRLEQWSRKLLERESVKQILPEGIAAELSTNYMLFIMDSLLGVVCCDTNYWSRSRTQKLLIEMSKASAHLIRPDKTLPFLGDNDSGRGFILSENLTRRDLYQDLACLLERPAKSPCSQDQIDSSLLWIFAENAHQNSPPIKSIGKSGKLFDDAGIYCFRSSADCDADWLIFRGGGVNRAKWVSQSHHHADALSFEFVQNGTSIFVDPGTYAYSIDETQRASFRSSAVHNTLSVEDNEQCDFGRGRFGVWKLPNSYYLPDNDPENAVIAMACSYSQVCHERVLRIYNTGLIIEDKVQRPAEKTAVLSLQLAPGLTAKQEESGWTVIESNTRIRITELNGLSLAYHIKPGFVSVKYGKKEAAYRLVVKLPSVVSCEIKTEILKL
jgi:hypothetical protein